jgi:LemA protein
MRRASVIPSTMRNLQSLVASVAVLTTGCGYNRIQSLDEAAQAYQGQIEVQLTRRAELIPNLVNTVKGYAAHEQAVFTQVANARAGVLSAVQSHDAAAMANANAQLSGALGRLIAVAEAYPNLKADQTFIRFQDELTGTENRIATARGDYNGAANAYNAYIRQFPQVITAKVTGAKPRKYFEAAPGSTQAPSVDFSTPAAPAQPVPPTGAPGAKAPVRTP